MNAAHGLCQSISPGATEEAEPRHSFLLWSVDTKLIEIHNPSLNREHLAGVCTGNLTTSHNLMLLPQPGGLESHCLCILNQGSWDCADLWMHTFLTGDAAGREPHERAELK